jgi:exodeoxyribonuclease VII small subunit
MRKEQMAEDKAKKDLTKDTTIEQDLDELQKLIDKMQDPAVTLEESFELYKRGMDLVRSCNERIDTVEKKVKMMNPDGSMSDFRQE